MFLARFRNFFRTCLDCGDDNDNILTVAERRRLIRNHSRRSYGSSHLSSSDSFFPRSMSYSENNRASFRNENCFVLHPTDSIFVPNPDLSASRQRELLRRARAKTKSSGRRARQKSSSPYQKGAKTGIFGSSPRGGSSSSKTTTRFPHTEKNQHEYEVFESDTESVASFVTTPKASGGSRRKTKLLDNSNEKSNKSLRASILTTMKNRTFQRNGEMTSPNSVDDVSMTTMGPTPPSKVSSTRSVRNATVSADIKHPASTFDYIMGGLSLDTQSTRGDSNLDALSVSETLPSDSDFVSVDLCSMDSPNFHMPTYSVSTPASVYFPEYDSSKSLQSTQEKSAENKDGAGSSLRSRIGQIFSGKKSNSVKVQTGSHPRSIFRRGRSNSDPTPKSSTLFPYVTSIARPASSNSPLFGLELVSSGSGSLTTRNLDEYSLANTDGDGDLGSLSAFSDDNVTNDINKTVSAESGETGNTSCGDKPTETVPCL